MPRERIFEQGFFDQAARQVGLVRSGYQEAVKARLDEGERKFGDESLHKPLADLIREIEEEGLDVGGWSILAAQADALERLPFGKRAEFVILLQEITAHGVQIAYLTKMLRELADV